MANHCIDVICSGCGRVYCLRGCGTDFTADRLFLNRWMASVPLNERFEYENHKGDCCSGNPVYSYSCGDIKQKP